ncbi:hypothetical protein ACLMJK_007478 [Lecanora helva]
MLEEASLLQRGLSFLTERGTATWDNLGKNNLWKRILKNVIATTLLVSICLIPGAKQAIGRAAYLGAITTVFGHPGRRFGQMAEALILVVLGTSLGVAWSTLGVYLGSLVIEHNPPAAYAIRGAFLASIALTHGFLRSRSPRLFIFVLLMIIVSVVSLTSTAKAVTSVSVTRILYPILIAVACLILINLCIFPEFSSRFLGQTTIETLHDTAKALEAAGEYFIEVDTAATHLEKPSDTSTENVSKADHTGQNKDSGRTARQSLLISHYRKCADLLSRHKTSMDAAEGNGVKPKATPIPEPPSIKTVTDSKAKIRGELGGCKEAQQECNYELAFSVLPPRNLKPLSITAMKRIVANTIAVIGTCESKFALLGGDRNNEDLSNSKDKPELAPAKKESQLNFPNDQVDSSGHSNSTKLVNEDHKHQKPGGVLELNQAELDLIKPKREIEFGDARLLLFLLQQISKPYQDLHDSASRAIEVVIACIAYTYDVPKVPSGAQVPKGIMIAELDIHVTGLQQALLQFDADSASALEGAAAMQEAEGLEPDIMPREEIFLLSSFLLNVRQAVTHIEDMLKHSRELVLRHQERRGRRRLYAPRIRWSKWLYTGDAEDEGMPAPARTANRQGNTNDADDDDDDDDSLASRTALIPKEERKDVEKNAGLSSPATPSFKTKIPSMTKKTEVTDKNMPRMLRLRAVAADTLEWIQTSEDVLYAMKLSVALFLVLWPAFIASWNTWYSLNRGLWAALQLILITEVSIGTSVMTFVLRAVGTTIGCLWGYAAIEARGSNRIVCAAMIFVALFPCCYVQLGTKYPKAGMVCIVSICVVSLASELETVPGTPTETFLRRWIAFLIGGSVALLVEVILFPVKARSRLTDSLTAALHQINEMERCIAFGIESAKKIDIYAPGLLPRFERASSKANAALTAAETFLPFCSTEPRIKGSFEGLALIYGEILFVLHQIVDRMDNMLQLRTAYGSGPLEDLNEEIYPYRRNVAGSITLTLFAIHSALTTKMPLPQYLPSARLAHLRMINRVREVVLHKVSDGQESPDVISKLARQRAVRRKYMSWNAASAAQAEIIEFLEELIDLTKLLVGANEFRSGLLIRPTYRDYAKKGNEKGEEGDESEEARDEITDPRTAAAEGASRRRRGTTTTLGSPGRPSAGYIRRRRGTTSSSRTEEEDVPASLRRIQSRKIEAGLKKRATNESLRATMSGSTGVKEL